MLVLNAVFLRLATANVIGSISEGNSGDSFRLDLMTFIDLKGPMIIAARWKLSISLATLACLEHSMPLYKHK
jgi:hypothetical protein